MNCLELGGKFMLIKDLDFSPLGQIQSYIDPNPITTLKRPLDLCIGALNCCWLLDEEQAIESKISRELRELTLDTWELEWYTLPSKGSALNSMFYAFMSYLLLASYLYCILWFELVKPSSYLFLKDLFTFSPSR